MKMSTSAGLTMVLAAPACPLILTASLLSEYGDCKAPNILPCLLKLLPQERMLNLVIGRLQVNKTCVYRLFCMPLLIYQVLQGELVMCGGQPWPETSLRLPSMLVPKYGVVPIVFIRWQFIITKELWGVTTKCS